MKIIITLTLLLGISLSANNDVYSESNSYNINQTNSNNTYIDNSQMLSNNSFSLFQGFGNNYSKYMNYEPIVYISAYGTNAMLGDGSSQSALSIQLGVYEDVYLLYEQGNYKDGEYTAEYGEASANGTFVNTGFSYHFDYNDRELFSVDFIQRKMTDITYDKYDEYGYELDEKSHKTRDTTIFMFNYTKFRSNQHSGFLFGYGMDSNGNQILKLGLNFRYF